jgi:hypothetical protein
LKEVVDFISYINKKDLGTNKGKIERYFESLQDITMTNIKIYYLKLLQNLVPESWSSIFTAFCMNRKTRLQGNNIVDAKGNKFTSSSLRSVSSIGPGTTTTTTSTTSTNLDGTNLTRLGSYCSTSTSTSAISKNSNTLLDPCIFITTKDAYTLTDGPTIFISNDIEKIAKFCIQQANIPSAIMDEIMKKIEYNNVLNERIDTLEREVEYVKEKADKLLKNTVSETDKSRGITVSGRNKSSKDGKKFNRNIIFKF